VGWGGTARAGNGCVKGGGGSWRRVAWAQGQGATVLGGRERGRFGLKSKALFHS
jgi:hypothetical protein